MKILEKAGDIMGEPLDEKNIDEVFGRLDSRGKLTTKHRNELIKLILKYLHSTEK